MYTKLSNIKIFFLCVLVLLSIFFFKYIKDFFISKLSDNDHSKTVNVILILIFLNIYIILFNRVYSGIIMTRKGVKGNKGTRGPRGIPGKNAICDISKQKIGTFTNSSNIIKKEIIDNFDETTLDLNKKRGAQWIIPYKKPKKFTRTLGTTCKKCKKKGGFPKNKKPIIGCNVNYDKVTKKITTLQYMYDRNKVHNPNKYSPSLLGKKIGTLINNNNTEQSNFVCPANSAISKIESLSDQSGGIVGLKFYCQDINTGRNVKFSKNRDSVYFGIEPEVSNRNYVFQNVKCQPVITGNNVYPGFFSGVRGSFKNNKIQNLQFSNCTYFKN